MAFRRFELVDVRLPTFLKHDATHIRVMITPDIEDSENRVIDKLLIYKNAEKKDAIIEKSGVKKEDIIEVDNRDALRIYEFNINFEDQDVYFLTYNIWYNDATYAGWARPNMITSDTDGYSHSNVEVMTPRIELTTDPNNAELGGFVIKTSPFRTFLGTATHKYTSWYIEDFTGNVIWKRERDKINLTSIRVPNHILELNSIYTIKVIHFSNGLVPSNPGKLIIKTKGELTEVEKTLLAASGKLQKIMPSPTKVAYGYERPVLTGGKDTVEEIEKALDKSMVKMLNTSILNGNLKLNIEKLNSQIKSLTTELNTLKAKLKEITNENKELKLTIEEKNKLIKQLKSNLVKLEEARRQIDKLTKENKLKDKVITNLHSTISELRAQLNRALLTIESKDRDLNNLDRHLRETIHEMDRLNEVLRKSLEITINNVMKTGSYTSRIKYLEEKIKEEENTIARLEAEKQKQIENYKKSQNKIKELEDYINILETKAVPAEVFDKAMAKIIELTINNALLKSCCNR